MENSHKSTVLTSQKGSFGFIPVVARKVAAVPTPREKLAAMGVNTLVAMANSMHALFVKRCMSVELKQLLVSSDMRIVGSYGLKSNPRDIDVECWRLDFLGVLGVLEKIWLMTGLKVHCFCYGWDGYHYHEDERFRVLCAPRWTRLPHKTISCKDTEFVINNLGKKRNKYGKNIYTQKNFLS